MSMYFTHLAKDPKIFDNPIAIISWLASKFLVNALAIVICSMMASNGITMIADPSSCKMDMKLCEVPFTVMDNGGGLKFGSPGLISPTKVNGLSFAPNEAATIVLPITAIAFRDVDRNHNIFCTNPFSMQKQIVCNF